MQATAIYTDQDGNAYTHISITALTETDIDIMEAIEAAICRWIRNTTFNTTVEDHILETANTALLLMEEYGPNILRGVAAPHGAHHPTWETIRSIAYYQDRMFGVRTGRTRQVKSAALANHHLKQAADLFRDGEHDMALSWLNAAETVDPRVKQYDPWDDDNTASDDAPDYVRLRSMVRAGAVMLAA